MGAKIDRGSEWRKWDLHLHSPFTWVNNRYPSDITEKVGFKGVDEFVNKVIESGLSVVGLTNYFKFSNQDFEIKQKLAEKGITTFLNLEVRLTNVNKADQMIDYHVIFNPNLEDQLIKNLLGSLKAELGSTEKAFNQLSKNEIENKASIHLSKLLEKLQENGSGLSGEYITGFLSRGHGSATSDSEKKTQTVYESIARQTDILLHSSDEEKNVINDREYWLRTSEYVRPLLQSSDSHSLQQIGLKYSWIKADTTFEGLRQILFEPEGRVEISQDKPEKKSPYLVIDHVTFNQKVQERNTETTISLNSNLNTVIGGRANGKSTLTNSIAESLKNSLFEPRDNVSGKGMYTFVNSDFKVYWQNETEFNNDREVEFIPQDYMIKLAENDDARNDLIRSTVKTDINNYSKILDYEKSVQDNESCIRQLLSDWEIINKQLLELRAPEGDKEGIELQLKSLDEAIKEQSDKSNFSIEKQQKYRIAYDKWKSLENKRRLSELNLQNIATLKNEKITLNVHFLKTNDIDYNEKISLLIDDIEKEVNEKWKNRLTLIEEEQKQNSIEEGDQTISILGSQDYIDGQMSIKSNQKLESLSEQQKTESIKLEKFNKFEDEKSALEDEKNNKQQEIIEKYKNFEQYQKNLKNEFKAQPNNGNIEIAIEFSDVPFEHNIQYLRGRHTNNDQFISEFDKNRSGIITQIFEQKDLSFNQNGSKESLIKDVFSKQWTSLNYILKYENDTFSQMSQGKKSFVILTLILEFSQEKKPVIIDQPEDSLDNRSIYQELTKYLKTKKKERQIILVTHNPNVVVGADAENVIVANQHSSHETNKDGIQFSYVNGSLENTFVKNSSTNVLNKKGIREHVIEILEGGKEAFRERENKYKSDGTLR